MYVAGLQDFNPGRANLIPSPPAFHTASDKSWAWRPGNEARELAPCDGARANYSSTSYHVYIVTRAGHLELLFS